MSKRRRGLALTVAMMTMVASCGSDDAKTSDPTTTAAAPADTTGDTVGGDTTIAGADPTTPAATKCDDSDPVKMGASLALTGPTANQGATYQPAIELAVQQANEGTLPSSPGVFGIMGRCITLITKDDAGDPTQAAQAVRQLVFEDEIDLMAGPTSTATVGGTLDIINEAKIPQVVVSGLDAAGDDPAKYPYTFVPSVTVNVLATTWGGYLQDLGATHPALLVANVPLGLSSRDAITDAGDLDVAATEVVESGTTDMTAAMQKLKDSNPDSILILALGADAIAALKARADLGMTDIPTISFIGTATKGVLDAVGEAGLQNVYAGQAIKNCTRTTDDGAPRGEICAALHDALKAYTGEDPLTINLANASLAYDMTVTSILGANGAGSLDADAVKAWLETNPVNLAVATIQFSAESHLGVHPEDLTYVLATSQSDGVLTAG